MTASEWVTLTISVAGVFVGLVVVATIKYRKPLIIVCVTLVIAALAIAAISTIINLGPSFNSSSSDASSSPTSTPLQGPYVDAEGCFYDVTNDSNAGAEAHQIRDQGRIQQNFTATLPYIRSFSVVIGYEGTRPGKVKLQLRDGDKILRQDSVEIVNNRGTQLRLDPPIRVEIGRTYTLEVINTSGRTLGIYMQQNPRGKPEGIGNTVVLSEEGRLDGQRKEALTGCVKGAIAR